MPKYISTTKKFMCDPKLRVRPPSLGGDKTARIKYEQSSIAMPSIWSWTMLRGMTRSSARDYPMSKSDLLDARDQVPYFPFCKELYNFATGVATCDWAHIVGEDSKSTNNTYNFPCGCTNPKILFRPLGEIPIKSSSAFVSNPEATLFNEVPRCPVFAQGAAVKKRKRKKSGLSLTDNRTYSRKVRERSKKTAKTAKGCSNQLMEEDVPTDSD